MAFSSCTFIFFFLTSVFILYRIVPGIKAKNILLLVFSFVFYTCGEPKAVILLIASVCMNYFFGIAMKSGNKYRKIALAAGVTANLLLLAVFKYTGFAVDIVNLLPGVNIKSPGISLPVGISFYTFQAISYIVDAYRDPEKIQRSFWRLALYIMFFPQLIAGPIIKYHEFSSQLENRTTSPKMTAEGVKRFIAGLSKKLLIADTMALAVDHVYSLDASGLSLPLTWLGAVAYIFQIYFDFSGYSDMALGLGKMFGFTFSENFSYPYAAADMKDFWRRWHISLSSWFREYLYIPLGGNRRGKARTALNLFIVFFMTGLWHGAGLNFIVWGVFNGLFVILESCGILKTDRWNKVLRHIYTMLVTTVGFVFFRSETLSYALSFIKNMFNPFTLKTDNASWSLFTEALDPLFITTLVCAALISVPIWKKMQTKIHSAQVLEICETGSYILSLLLFVLCVTTLVSASYNPFIYFRF